MFGYIIINKPELKFREFDVYREYYCGLCRKLKEKYGALGQITLSYDMTFLIMLLTGLYEPATSHNICKCLAHPFEKHPYCTNRYTDYIADMNLLLTYYKCMDDWQDEKKLSRRSYAGLIQKKIKEINLKYPEKGRCVAENLQKITECEQKKETDIDLVSGYFGEIMAELMIYEKDMWETDLRSIGFFLGKFIYLMDAYEDMEKDEKKQNYNPFRYYLEKNPLSPEELEAFCEQTLTMMMAECSKAFERLPIIQDVEILRNILYSGVWCRFEIVKQKRRQSRAHSPEQTLGNEDNNV